MMYVPVSAPGDPTLSRKCHPHPRLWWRVVGSVAKFLRPIEHFCPHTVLAVRFRGTIILGINIPCKKPSLRKPLIFATSKRDWERADLTLHLWFKINM